MREQIQAGVCQDITKAIDGDFKDSFYPAGVQAFIVDGKSYGLPDSVGPIVFWITRSYVRKRTLIQARSNIGRISSMRSKGAKRQASFRSPSEDPTNGPSSSIPRF